MALSPASSAESSGAGVYFDAVIAKAVTTSRASTTTLADDPELAFAIVNGATYYYETVILYDEAADSGTPDLKFAMVPTTSTLSFSECTVQRLTTTGSADLTTFATISGAASAGAAATLRCVHSFGWFTVATASGTMAYQWAQNASSANAVRVFAGSTLAYRQLQ